MILSPPPPTATVYKFDVTKIYPYFRNQPITYDGLKLDDRINDSGYLMLMMNNDYIVSHKGPNQIKWEDLRNWEKEGGFKKTRQRKNKNKKKSRRFR
jgi:hypothetical protein